MIPVREDPLVPRESSSAEYNAPVLRKNKWLADHEPHGVIRRPFRGQPDMEAAVDGKVIATGYDGYLKELMDAVDRAEAEGSCPMHPAGSS